jgi:beta-glucosidase
LFPFGFGLSYTKFELSDLKATKDDISVTVKNVGDRAGAEVVQVYVAAPSEAGEPPRQLKGFAKVRLEPGNSMHLEMSLDRRAYSIWDTKANDWTTVAGDYTILVGTSSRDLPLKTTVAIPSAGK